MLSSILIQGTGASLAVGPVVLCTVVSLALGVAVALIHMYQNTYSRNFIITLALLPAIVQAVIMIVNGNLGTGVAVMGAFSLVRFRSVPGDRERVPLHGRGSGGRHGISGAGGASYAGDRAGFGSSRQPAGGARLHERAGAQSDDPGKSGLHGNL